MTVGFLLLCALSPAAVASVHIDAARKVYRLDSPASTYAVGVNERGELQPLYWGARLADADHLAAPHTLRSAGSPDASTSVTPQEFAGWGQGIYNETALKISFPDGNRDLELRFVDAKADGEALVIALKDIERAIVVTVRYEMDRATGIVARSAHIENRTAGRVVVDEAAAATWFLPSQRKYTLEYLAGRWGGEFQVQRQLVGSGKVVMESRRGNTGHQNAPWFALQAGETPAEEHGDTWFGTLAWSGSWRIAVEQDVVHTVRVTGGYNPFDFAYALQPGEALDTPVFYAGYSPDGWGGASRALHRFELGSIVPSAPSPKVRPVLYNSWEATRFGLNVEGQLALADIAAKLGVERFTVDDAWFGHRTSDNAGLGDWYVNRDKFPGGLKPLIDKVRSLGMDFGLWVEPEMVNADSDLYRAHPDWVLNFEGRPRTESRHQLVLNLAREDVRNFVFHAMDDLLSQNNISFLKWDYNRSFSEPGWPAARNGAQRGEQEKLYVLFTQNLYNILAKLRARHPGVEIESCASGGGRVDLGILRYTDQFWPSDNMDAFDRLRIQDGISQFVSPGVSMAWVTHSPDFSSGRIASLRYRFLSAMQVGLGIGDDLRGWSEADVKEAAGYVAAYKRVRETVQRGALYRLMSPEAESPQSATEYVSGDRRQAVVFAFLHSSQMGYPFPVVRLLGLDPDARYQVHTIAGKLLPGTPEEESGAYWMHAGLQPDMKGDFNAAAFTFSRVP